MLVLQVGECARVTGKYVEDARATVAHFCAAPRIDYAVIFVGAGVTGAVAKMAHLLGIHPRVAYKREGWTIDDCSRAPNGDRPVVFVTSMEHHSNVVYWREMDCDVEVRSVTCTSTSSARPRTCRRYVSTLVPAPAC